MVVGNGVVIFASSARDDDQFFAHVERSGAIDGVQVSVFVRIFLEPGEFDLKIRLARRFCTWWGTPDDACSAPSHDFQLNCGTG